MLTARTTSDIRTLLPAGADSLPYDRLVRGEWSDGDRICAMAAMVPGASSVRECVAAGWPGWLPTVVLRLYDDDAGASDEKAAADAWFRQLADVVSRPVDYERGRRRFLVAVLQPVAHLSDTVRPVIGLHQQELAGDPVDTAAWVAAANAARTAPVGWAAAQAAHKAALFDVSEAWHAAAEAYARDAATATIGDRIVMVSATNPMWVSARNAANTAGRKGLIAALREETRWLPRTVSQGSDMVDADGCLRG